MNRIVYCACRDRRRRADTLRSDTAHLLFVRSFLSESATAPSGAVTARQPFVLCPAPCFALVLG